MTTYVIHSAQTDSTLQTAFKCYWQSKNSFAALNQDALTCSRCYFFLACNLCSGSGRGHDLPIKHFDYQAIYYTSKVLALGQSKADNTTTSTPDRIRTCNPRFRRPMLCPVELRVQNQIYSVKNGLFHYLLRQAIIAIKALIPSNKCHRHINYKP